MNAGRELVLNSKSVHAETGCCIPPLPAHGKVTTDLESLLLQSRTTSLGLLPDGTFLPASSGRACIRSL